MVLPYGIDLSRFADHDDRASVRRSLGLPETERLVIHVGSLTPQKNQRFLLRVFAEAHRRAPELRLAVVGDGPLRSELERMIRALGITNSVMLLGGRNDVPRLLAAASAFVLTSLYEGSPLSLLEAQASGLPCLVPSHVGDVADGGLGNSGVRTIAVDERIEVWAAALIEVSEAPRLSASVFHQRMRGLGRDAASSRKALEAVYHREVDESSKNGAVQSAVRKAVRT